MTLAERLVVVVAICVFEGCPASPPAVPAGAEQSCESKLAHAVLSGNGCTEQQLKVDVVLRTSPACREIFGDAGFDPCGKVVNRGDR